MNAPFAEPRQRVTYDIGRNITDEDIGDVAREAITLRAVTSRLWVMALATATCLAVGVSYIMMRAPNYTAIASVLYNGSVSNENQQSAVRAAADVTELSTGLYQLLAREARLLAEADAKSEISFPPELTGVSNLPEVQQAIKVEIDLFKSRLKSTDDGKETLSQQLQLLKDEAISLNKQVAYAATQQSLTDDELAGVRRLADRGLAPITRQRDLEATAAALASRKIEFDSELLDSKQKAVETAQRLVDVDTERRTSALEQLQDTRKSLQTTRARLQAASLLSSSLTLSTTFDSAEVENQADMIRSDEMTDRVVQLLGLRDDKSFLFGDQPRDDADPNADDNVDPEQRAQLARAILQRNLIVERAGRGSRLDVEYTSTNADHAVNIANAYTATYAGTSATRDDRQAAQPNGSTSAGRILRQAVVGESGPGRSKVLAAMFVCGVILGSAIALLLEMGLVMRRSRAARSNTA